MVPCLFCTIYVLNRHYIIFLFFIAGGNVLLLNVWGEKSPPYMQALHFLFALGSFIAPLIAKPFLQENIVPTNNCANTNSSQYCASNNSIGDSSNNLCFSSSSGNTFPVKWAFWICAFPLAITGIGFLVFVFNKSCSLQDTKTNNEDARKTKQGSLMYRVTFLSLFSVFLLIYAGLEEAYGGYIFAFGSTSSLKMSKDGSALLNSGFWGSFALARLAAVPISKYLPPSKMLCLDLAGCLLGSAVLISQIKDGDCSAADSTKLWVGTVIFGISTSSVFPAGISWAENFVTVPGRTASLFLVTSSTGAMLIPLSVGSTIGETVGPCSLMICALVISVLMIVVFLSILVAARCFKRKGIFAGMLFQPSKSKREELRDGQPDEVLQHLDKNNDCDKEMAI